MIPFYPFRYFLALLVFSGLLFSCERPFVFSPYEADVEEAYKNTTQLNLDRINASNTNTNQTFKIALLSDTHYHYDQLREAISIINSKDDIAFVIVTGDITENGLMQEYVFFYEAMQELDVPYVTVIGNHDYLSNGGSIYNQMFGAYNYTFTYNNVLFVLFDNVFWESEKHPDFDWFANTLKTGAQYNHIIPLAHIPPFDQQFANKRNDYHTLLADAGITLSIHGHKHDYFLGTLYDENVNYLTVPSPQKKSYCELIISSTTIDVIKIDY